METLLFDKDEIEIMIEALEKSSIGGIVRNAIKSNLLLRLGEVECK